MFGYMITAFAGVFWVFRLIVMLAFTADAGFPIVPMDVTCCKKKNDRSSSLFNCTMYVFWS